MSFRQKIVYITEYDNFIWEHQSPVIENDRGKQSINHGWPFGALLSYWMFKETWRPPLRHTSTETATSKPEFPQREKEMKNIGSSNIKYTHVL